jgi:hypothetical protein
MPDVVEANTSLQYSRLPSGLQGFRLVGVVILFDAMWWWFANADAHRGYARCQWRCGVPGAGAKASVQQAGVSRYGAPPCMFFVLYFFSCFFFLQIPFDLIIYFVFVVLAVDCVVSAWSAYGQCSTTCGGGTQTRTRSVTTQPDFGGAACPALEDSQKCNTLACPVDCGVSAWSEWSACDKTCGGGSQSQTRTITQQAANGGAACPTTLSQTRACGTDPCPVDCVVSEWGSWLTCSKACGGGEQSQTRTVVTPAAYGGKACPVLSQSQQCNSQPCPVNCVVSDWSAFGECSTRCGGGVQSQSRTVVTPAANGGVECPALAQSQPCNTQACPGTSLCLFFSYILCRCCVRVFHAVKEVHALSVARTISLAPFVSVAPAVSFATPVSDVHVVCRLL